MEGHGKPCYYCGKPCNALTGDPGGWPVALCHSDEPGVVKWHHATCVSQRLEGKRPFTFGNEVIESQVKEIDRLSGVIAQRAEHDDLAPHDGCECRLCTALRTVSELHEAVRAWQVDAAYAHMDKERAQARVRELEDQHPKPYLP